MEFKPRKANVIADSLSRKPKLAMITRVTCDLADQIKEGLSHDPPTRSLMEMAREGKTRKFWVEDGLLLTVGN